MKCEAKQHGSSMACTHCNLVWDINDPHPPMCYEVDEVPERRTSHTYAEGYVAGYKQAKQDVINLLTEKEAQYGRETNRTNHDPHRGRD